MAAFSHNGEPGSALDRELRGLNCRGCDCRSVRISELERELAAAQLARDAQKVRADDLLEEYTKVKDSLKRAEARAEAAEKAVKLCASAVPVAQERIDAAIAEGEKK